MRAKKIRNKHRESRTVAKVEMRDKIKGNRKRKINDERLKTCTGGAPVSQKMPFGKTHGSKIQTQNTDLKCELES